jgi:hypothetical protein
MSATDKLFNDERRVYLMGACVRRESHAQFCEGPEVQFLRPTHQNYRDLKQEVGLGAFEGRSWRGFHHHVTLCIAALRLSHAVPLPDDAARRRSGRRPLLSPRHRSP